MPAVDAINDGGDILAVDGLVAVLAFSWGSTATATKVLGETGTLEYWENMIYCFTNFRLIFENQLSQRS